MYATRVLLGGEMVGMAPSCIEQGPKLCRDVRMDSMDWYRVLIDIKNVGLSVSRIKMSSGLVVGVVLVVRVVPLAFRHEDG